MAIVILEYNPLVTEPGEECMLRQVNLFVPEDKFVEHYANIMASGSDNAMTEQLVIKLLNEGGEYIHEEASGQPAIIDRYFKTEAEAATYRRGQIGLLPEEQAAVFVHKYYSKGQDESGRYSFTETISFLSDPENSPAMSDWGRNSHLVRDARPLSRTTESPEMRITSASPGISG